MLEWFFDVRVHNEFFVYIETLCRQAIVPLGTDTHYVR